MNHKRTLSVALAIVFLAIAVMGTQPAHAVGPVWVVSLDANSLGPTDALPQASGSFAKTFNIGAIVNASGTTGTCGANCLSGVFGWQFSIVYDSTSFVPQGDPTALAANDFAGQTVNFGAQSGTGNPGWASLISPGNNAFGSSVILPVDATHQKIQVFYTVLAPHAAVNIFPTVSGTVKGNLLASVAFEIINKPSTAASFSITDVKIVDMSSTPLPNIIGGNPISESISNNPPTASFTVTSLPSGDASCLAVTGANCGDFAVKVDGSGSSDVEAAIADPAGYFWDWGDGTQDNFNNAACGLVLCNQGSIAYHDYGIAGTFQITLRVVDSSGATGSARDGLGAVIVNAQPSHTSQTIVLVPKLPLTVSVDCGTGQTAGKPFNCTVTATGGTAPYFGTGVFSVTEPVKGVKTESYAVTDSASGSASGSAIVTISPQPLVVTVDCGSAQTAGKPFNCVVTATGGTGPYTGTGTIPVTQPAKGTFTESFTVTDANGASASGSAVVNVAAQPLVVTATCPSSGLTAGKPFDCTVSATGGTGPYTGTGTISKTEPAKGTFIESFTVTDANGASAIGTASVTIGAQPLVVTVVCPASGLTAGKPFTCNVSATGGTGPYTGTGAISRTEPTKGIFTESFTVTDGNSISASASQSVTIDAQPLVVTVTCQSSGVTAGKPFNCTVEAIGGTAPYTGTGVFSRTEDIKGSKTESFTVVDANGVGAVGSATVSVSPQPFVVTATCPTNGVTAGKPFTCNVSATGGTTPYTGTGSISITEPVKGTKTESFTVTDANGVSLTVTATVDVAPQPLVASVSCPANANAGQSFDCTVTATGGTGPYQGTGTFSITVPVKGTAIESFTVTDANSISASASATVSIAGTPPSVIVTCPTSGVTAGKPFNCTVEATGGTSPYTGTGTFSRTEPFKGTHIESFTVMDANGATATGTATVVVGGQPIIVTVTCPSTGVTAGKPFDCTVSASGGTAPYTGTGTISVTEPIKGTATESFTVTDANGATASASTTVNVGPQPLVVTVSCPASVSAGQAFNCSVSATGGTGPYTGTGTFSVTQSIKGTFTESFDVTDSNSVTATGSATVSVSGTPLVVTVTCPATGVTAGKPFDCTVEASGDTGPYSGTGTFSVTEPAKGIKTESFSVSDANGVTASGSATVTVDGQPLVATVTCPTAGITAGKPFNCTVSATGGTQPYTGTGAISVTEPVKGTFLESFTVTDANGATAVATATVFVAPQPLVITVSCPTSATAGASFTCNVSATGGTAPYTGTGSFSITEPAKGSHVESFTVSDANLVSASASATVDVAGTPLVVAVSCPASAMVGEAFDCTVSATGDTAPYTGTGTFTVTELSKGSKVETFSVTSANGIIASASATVTITGQPLIITVTCPTTATAGVSFICAVQATGGTQPYSGVGNFTITESTKGTRTESFTVADANGVSASASGIVTVTPQALSASFTVSASPTLNQPVIFTGSATGGTGPYTFVWVFGDTGTATGNPATHTYTLSGNYTVQLAVTDANGAVAGSSQLVVIPVIPPPVARFTESASSVPTGTTINFDALSSTSGGTITSYTWNFGDGATATGVTTSHAYSIAGNYTVTLTVNDSNGLSGSSTSLKIITDRSPTAAFTFTPTNPLTGQAVSFDATSSSDPDGSIVSYAWSFGDSTTGSGVTTSHVYTASGTFTITLVVTDNSGSTGTATGSIIVTPANVAGAHASLAKWSAQPDFHHESLSKNPINTFTAYGVNDGNRTVWVYVQFHIISDTGSSTNLYTQRVQLAPTQAINGKTDSRFSAIFVPPGTGTFTVVATIYYSAQAVAPPIGDASFHPDTTSAKSFSITVVP